ncbi:hypothetical protein AG1IA_06986 [Rhizoctonia solani AG-1 IA]|uniref:Uncharacterized protein n=1 Tax=Thanatephorus cucumeris (strain AG1-IA) TaxID=983506 RepID=L8WRH9_THACA|nr:hypothetical protein AG1IA_06986 [Rhizoctonia solani AG-1 IA]
MIRKRFSFIRKWRTSGGDGLKLRTDTRLDLKCFESNSRVLSLGTRLLDSCCIRGECSLSCFCFFVRVVVQVTLVGAGYSLRYYINILTPSPDSPLFPTTCSFSCVLLLDPLSGFNHLDVAKGIFCNESSKGVVNGQNCHPSVLGDPMIDFCTGSESNKGASGGGSTDVPSLPSFNKSSLHSTRAPLRSARETR